MKTILGVLLVAGIVVAGCGGSTDSDEDQIRSLTGTFAQNMKDEKYADACESYSPAAIEAMEAEFSSCEETMELASSLLTEEDLDLLMDDGTGEVEVTGDTATLTYEGDTTNYEKVDGTWMMAEEN